MANWDSTGLADFNVSGYSDAMAPPMVRKPMRYGPAKIRPQVTDTIREVQGTVMTDYAGTFAMDTFYEQNKADIFQKYDPRTRQSFNYRFTRPPVYRNLGYDTWTITLGLEIVSTVGGQELAVVLDGNRVFVEINGITVELK